MELQMLWEWLNQDVDWGARIPAFAGLALSIFAVWKGQTRIRLELGCYDRDDQITVSNLSPHAIEVTSVGVVESDGSLEGFFDGPDPWPGLPIRIEARSEKTITLHAALAPYSAYIKKHYGRGGCFIRIAGGRAYSDTGWLRRRWWWVRSQLEKLFKLGSGEAAKR